MKLTLRQKIENLTWTDLIKKLKDILSNFSTKFDSLTGRVSVLESSSGSGGGGGSQDLQSVLDAGNSADSNIVLNSFGSLHIIGTNEGYSVQSLAGGTAIAFGTNVNVDGMPKTALRYQGVGTSGSVQAFLTTETLNTQGIFKIPYKGDTLEEYTLATLDDIIEATNLQKVLENGHISDGAILLTSVDSSVTVNNSDGVSRLGSGEVYLSVNGSANQLVVNGEGSLRKISTSGGLKNSLFMLPTKSVDGTYTIATLDDINAVGSLIPTYADNSAAVTGGLAVNHLYKTASGEIRVRV